jgi:hypothetical protein
MECCETQHDKATPFFGKPGCLTVSGVEQGEQRELYDARRDAEIPVHGRRLLVIRSADLDPNSRGRLRRRDRIGNLEAVRGLLPQLREPTPRRRPVGRATKTGSSWRGRLEAGVPCRFGGGCGWGSPGRWLGENAGERRGAGGGSN